jgi:undecaprenyl-diphosphatase
VVTGVVVALARWLPGGSIDERTTTWRHAAIVGLAQGLAIFPGLSRSGMTIAASLGAGLDRSWAARFSFLLGVPAVAAATLAQVALSSPELRSVGSGFWAACAVGSVAAGVTGYGALRIVIRAVSSHVFHRFSWYCLPLGLAVILWWVFR